MILLFSTQKGVKGLPLHIQIDTFEDPRQDVGTPAFHRGYCQVKLYLATLLLTNASYSLIVLDNLASES